VPWIRCPGKCIDFADLKYLDLLTHGSVSQYPATTVSFISNQGPNDISNNIKKKAAACPDMKFVVVGYSQGGGVATSGLANVVKNGNADRVIAVVLYAPFGGASPPKEFLNRTLQNCASGDPVSLHYVAQIHLDTGSNFLP